MTDLERKVLELRDEGLTFKAIGERLGVSGSRASQYVIRAQLRRDVAPFYSGPQEAEIRALVPESVARRFMTDRIFHWREVLTAYVLGEPFSRWPNGRPVSLAVGNLIKFVLRNEVDLPTISR
ncbi:sigma factor-like helix-turn-helix DNA-binding protein [Brevundimonas sp.]|uniref:sigma factor-like helix-turn-helix DNA-binding protein n=1 Tax=Brevundimonas sp. TaxID=1871086 RepID=UPI002FDA00F1